MRTATTEAQAGDFRAYRTENAALDAAMAGCPDGFPVVVSAPGGGYYASCAATGVFYTKPAQAFIEEGLAELLGIPDWVQSVWP